eukprot:3026327-Pyramimonas_sp.AAC.1
MRADPAIEDSMGREPILSAMSNQDDRVAVEFSDDELKEAAPSLQHIAPAQKRGDDWRDFVARSRGVG